MKAARRLGIPVGAGVATWDHLTTKGMVKAVPDRLFVWNELQRDDATTLHFVPRGRVVVTGAQLFDTWFERRPTCSRKEFLERVGLAVDRYVLYVGSSPNIAPPELELPFVRRWIGALRSNGDEQLAQLGVLVRPHPYSVEPWAAAGPIDSRTVVAPQVRPELPMNEQDEALYFHSLQFSDAVVGINTTAMVEAFIRRRPVLTIASSEFRETQQATLHFRNLRRAAGEALQTAATLDEHLAQLAATLAEPERYASGIERFLLRFVRPGGVDRPATELLVEGLEQLGDLRPPR